MYWDKLQRELCTLDPVEQEVLWICMHHPGVWEVFDQFMVPMLPCQHPLARHPKGEGRALKALLGSLEVAEALGKLDDHQHIRVTRKGGQGFEYVPAPWFGNFLLFLEDQAGPYCVNLVVNPQDERWSDPGNLPKRTSRHQAKLERIRLTGLAVTQKLFAMADIPTVTLSRKAYDEGVVDSLRVLHETHHIKLPFSAQDRAEIEDRYNAALITGEPPLEVMWSLHTKHDWSKDHLRIALHQAVWHRRLRIDLFEPLRPDRPMKPERRDVLSLYAAWFRRAP